MREILWAEEQIECATRMHRRECGHAGIDDAEPAILREGLEFLRALEDVEVAADDRIAAAPENFFELARLFLPRGSAQGKVNEEKGETVSEFNIVNKLLGAVTKVPLLELQRLVGEERVAIVAEEREEFQNAETPVLVIDVRRIRARMRNESVTLVHFHEAAEIGVHAVEQAVNGVADLPDDFARRVEIAIPLRKVTAHRPIEPRGIAEVIEEDPVGVFGCRRHALGVTCIIAEMLFFVNWRIRHSMAK